MFRSILSIRREDGRIELTLRHGQRDDRPDDRRHKRCAGRDHAYQHGIHDVRYAGSLVLLIVNSLLGTVIARTLELPLPQQTIH